MSDHDFKLAEERADALHKAISELSKLRAQHEQDVIAIGRLERSHDWHVVEIKKLETELEDVRQQRETLKVECRVLEKKLDETVYNRDRLREGFLRSLDERQAIEAEVKRRGEMLKRCLPCVIDKAGRVSKYRTTIEEDKLIEEIKSLED